MQELQIGGTSPRNLSSLARTGAGGLIRLPRASRLTFLDMSGTVSERYAALVAAGEIEHDPAQAAVATRLTRLNARLAEHRLARKSSSLGWLFGNRERTEETPLKGLYVHGDVGRGKTMLMDMVILLLTCLVMLRTYREPQRFTFDPGD